MSSPATAARRPACHVRSAHRAFVRPVLNTAARSSTPCRAIELDWSDSDTWVGLAAVVLGLGVGIGAPVFYSSRIDEDEKNLDELRKLNRETFKETGEYLTDEEIAAIRTPKWTDRREFVDDD
eukprot:jgi/Ulvmu1/9140/UM005_0238.1